MLEREGSICVFQRCVIKCECGGRGMPLSSFLNLTCLICFSSVFKRKVGWESFGKDGCGEEDGGSRVRRWRRHLKAHGHQGQGQPQQNVHNLESESPIM